MIFSIDATHSDGLGRMVNDECSQQANCKMKKVMVEGLPKLCLVAMKDIYPGKELRYDYGVRNLQWRNLKVRIIFFGAILKLYRR